VGTKPKRTVPTQGAEPAARTKASSAKPISEALGFLSIEDARKWSTNLSPLIFCRQIFPKGTSTTHIQVLYMHFSTVYNFITQIKIHT